MKKTYIRPSMKVKEVVVEDQLMAASGEKTDKSIGISSQSADHNWGADAKPSIWDNDEEK